MPEDVKGPISMTDDDLNDVVSGAFPSVTVCDLNPYKLVEDGRADPLRAP